MTSFTLPKQPEYLSFCVGDDGTYGAVCLVEADNFDGLFRINGDTWSTMQTLVANLATAGTNMTDGFSSVGDALKGN